MRTQTIQAPMQVVQSTGDVMVVLADGTTRPVHQGEVLPEGSVLQLADNATLQLEPTTAATQPELVAPAAEATAPQGTTAEIAAIQQALLQGIDPTLNLEATAAGGAPAAGGGGAAGSGNGGFVSIDRTGDETLATAGFDTTYQSSGLLDVADPAGVDDTVVVVPPPVMAPDPGALSETNLTTTGSGDVDLVNGSTAGGAPTSLTGDLNVDFAGDTGTVTFLSVDSQPALTSGGQPIVWTLSADGLTLVGTVDGATVLTVTLAADGSSYTVDLDGPLDHAVDSLMMNFGIQAQNSAGDITTGEIVLTVADDNPAATDNENSLDEDAVSVSGNVLTDAEDDVLGADGAAVTPLDIKDDFGRLTMDAAGVYTYTLDTDNAIVQGLDDGETLVREFTYTLTDNDGDVSTATLTITITGSNDGPTIEAQGEGLGVSETGLPEGSGVATDAQATGTFSIGDSDGLDDIKSLTIAGTTLNVAAGQTVADLVGSVVTTPYGQLTLDSFDAATGTFGYSYQLLNNVDNDSQQGADTNGFTETISLSVSDGTDSADTSFGVYIADDEPAATDNANSLDEYAVSVSGNVLTDAADDVLGADGAAVTPLDIKDDFGRLTMDAAGVYTYTLDTDNAIVQGLDDGETLVREFTYTLTDNDGDVSTATLTITITGSNDGPTIDAYGEGLGVSETGLPEGSGVVTDAQATGTFGIGDSDGLDDIKSLTIAGTTLNVAAGQTVADLVGSVVTTPYGQLTLDSFDGDTGTFSYSYQLLNNVDNDSQQGADTNGFTETISLSVSDGTSSADTSFGVYIADDEPTATDNANSLDEDAFSVSGNVLTDAVDDVLGADGAAVTPLDIKDDFGRLTMDAAGVYTYTLDTANAIVQGLDDGETLVREFTYTLTDNDGDVSTATLTITITGSNDGPTIEAQGEGLGVSEAGLSDGSGVATDAQASGTFSVGDSDGLDDIKSLTIAGTTLNVAAGQTVADLVGSVVNTPYGQLTLDSFDGDTGTFSYSYQLLNNVDNDSQQGADTNGFTETISLSVSDGTSSADTSFGVYIADDEPTATADNQLASVDDNADGVKVGTLSGLLGNDAFGADGAAVGGGITIGSGDKGGSITVDGAGNLVYTSGTDVTSPYAPVVETFTYTLTDGDGDKTTAQFTIELTDEGPSIREGAGSILADEDDISAAGNADGDGDLETPILSGWLSGLDFGTDGPGDIELKAVDDTGLLTLDGNAIKTLWDATNHVLSGVDATDPDNVLFTVTLTDVATGAYKFALLQPVQHGDVNEDDVGFAVEVVVTDKEGESATGSLSIDVDDDTPTVGKNLGVQLDDDALPGGNDGGTGDDSPNSANTAGTLSHSFGADGGHLSWSTAGAPPGFSYELDTQNSDTLYINQGGTRVMTLTLDPATGDYTVTQNAPVTHAEGQAENNASFDVGYMVTDNDGDSINGSLSINVDDDTPVAQDDYAVVEAGSEQDFNVCFVLDFSGSISNANVSTMLNAVKTAGATLFNEASGDVAVQIVAFSGTASDYPVVTSLADLSTLLDSLNPTLPGGHRPYDGMTDFTAAVTEVMNEFTPVVGSNNQVFFISDGNPNEQTSPGNSLSSAVIPLWNDFVDNNGVSVTAIGVGSNINTDRLQDVDVDGVGTPIMIAGFDALVSTLVEQISGGLVSGNILSGSDNTVGGGDDDSFGADGAGRISSIVIDGVTYSWDGASLITSSAGGVIAGTSLSHIVTAEGGDLSFDFANGAWSYQAADHVTGDKTESFTYTIMDSDGDTASATLNVYVEDPAPVVAQVDEDELPGGKTDGDLVGTVASGNVGELVVGSATGVTFALKSDTSGVTPASSDGTPLVYTVTGNTLVATAGSSTVFTLVVESDGDYTFTLSGPLDHPLANGDDDELLSLNFASLLQADNAGVPVALAGDFIVQVEDDIPVAHFDVDSIMADDADSMISGTVMPNDAQGADGAVVTPMDVRDAYGHLTMNAAGGYTYTLNSTNPVIQGLDEGESLERKFTYTLTDADGDVSTATLTITISGVDGELIAKDNTDSFSEEAVQGAVTGVVNVLDNDTDPDMTDKPLVVADTDSQTLFLLNPDDTLSGTAVGTITFDSAGGYSFTLFDDYKAQADALDAGETMKVGVEYTARNQDGATDDAVLRITIDGLDDAMNATDDAESFSEDAVQGAVTGGVNVLKNDTDPDASDNPLQVSDTASQLVYLLNPNGTLSSTAVGTITFTSAGVYTLALSDSYKAQANALDVGETLKVGVEYTARNQDGATDDAVLRVTITGSNDGPSISVSGEGLTVFEAGLPNGSSAATNSEMASGQFTVGDTDGLDDITSITIGSTTLTVGVGGLAGLVNSTVDTGYGSLQLTGYSNGTFNYKYTLTDPVDNDSKTGADTNGYIETVALSVSDGTSSANTSFGVYITDDVPNATNIVQSEQATSAINTNLLITLDVSGSMGRNANYDDMTRLEVAKQSILELFEQYEAQGNVMVKIVTFSDNGATLGTTWQTITEAKASLLSLSPLSGTNYDDALADTMTAFAQTGKLTGAQNVAYFLSDGQPNVPSGSPGINPTEEQAWTKFVNDNDIRAYALGMGAGSVASALDPIAYDGTGTGSGTNTNSQIITDLSQLTSTLVTIAHASPLNGVLTTGGTFGADGGHVESIVVGGITYTFNGSTVVDSDGGVLNNATYDATTHLLTVTTAAGGKIAVDMDNGVYQYSPPSSVMTLVQEQIGFTLIDNDGDRDSASLQITVDPAASPLVIRDDLVVTNANAAGGNDTIVIPEWALLANDTGDNSSRLDISSVANAVGGSIANGSIDVTFTESTSGEVNGGSFTYTTVLGTTTLTDVGDVSINRAQLGETNLDGTYRNEILLGRDGSVDTINGDSGDDILIGLGGNDTLNGGYGNDILDGGAGDDKLNGGDGIDTATYIDSLATVNVSLAISAGQNTGGAGTDTLNSIENLIGSNYADTLTGNSSANAIFGGAGNDTIFGGAGNDTMSGGSGADTLLGGLGADILTGGDGGDVFKFMTADKDGNADTIKDFTLDQDKLDLSDVLNDPTGNLSNYLTITGSGDDAVVKVYSAGNASGGGTPDLTIILDGLGSDLQDLQDYLHDDGVIK